jgi:CubicO group peptidase (beta-lactamase class C family)
MWCVLTNRLAMMRLLPLIAAVLLPFAPAHTQSNVDPAQIAHRLHPAARALTSDSTFDLLDRMRLYHVPGVSIAIVDGSRVVFARGYGVTEFGGTTPVDSTTLFLAGSISKPIFASGVLSLVERGALALDEDVNRRLTSWHVPESPFTTTEKVTLRRLLTHSAGLTVHGFPGYEMGSPLPTIAQVLDGAAPANTGPVRNDAIPGARWKYSGGGITVAQLLSTDVTHEAFPTLMQRLVLAPAGMSHSTYENPLPARRRSEAATGHERTDTPVPGRFHVYPEMAAAGLWTTASDLARWSTALSDAYKGRPGMFISPAMARQMVSRQIQTAPESPSWWGLGIGVLGDGPQIRFSHGGRDEGFVASLDMWPVRGQGIIVLTNGVSGQLLAEIQNAFREMYGIRTPDRE